jgi:hypothetical protein
MKRITGLTEEQAVMVAAAVVTFRAVRAAKIVKVILSDYAVEIETYAAEESFVNVTVAP